MSGLQNGRRKLDYTGGIAPMTTRDAKIAAHVERLATLLQQQLTTANLWPKSLIFQIRQPRRRKVSHCVGDVLGGIVFAIIGCVSAQGQTAPSTPAYGNPELVNIKGYTGSAQEDPQLTPDGKTLFFDSHDDSDNPSYLYWAKFIDYKTFQFMGKIDGANLGKGQVRGNADRNNNFYFASTAYIAQYGGARIARGTFNNGKVTGVQPITSIADQNASSSYFMLDGMITPNGNTLYYNIFMFEQGPGPASAQIYIAAKQTNGSFAPLPNSEELMKNVNAVGTVYGAQPSDDGLSLYFTAGGYTPSACKIFFTSRASTAEPFGVPQLVPGANDPYTYQGHASPNCSEAGSLSPDGKYLYVHRVLDSAHSQIYVLTRQ